jgi:RNA polymerase-binding protein DksA
VAKKAETKTKSKTPATAAKKKVFAKASTKTDKPTKLSSKKLATKADKPKAEKIDSKSKAKPESLKSDLKKSQSIKPDPKKPDPKIKSGSPSKAESKPKADIKPKADPKPDVRTEPKPAKAEPAPQPASEVKTGPGSGRKGITIVSPKPLKKLPVKPPAHSYIPASVGRLLDPKSPIRRPLIPSGPKAASVKPLGTRGDGVAGDMPKAKSPFNKKELDRFRQILIKKRAELAGDVYTMETEALRGESGSLSNMPQHLAEQGSEAYDQSLSLDLAAADRKLIREIDDALKRIEENTFGICERTGQPISLERLEELPWARLSIEAARELERQHLRA